MDDLDDLQASEFVTDTDDQDSLDERIDSEQRLRNQQLWASFQNAACCITKLYKDRAQPNLSPWVPFQNAASNLTTLYKDCIESQKRFARIGYQVGRRKRMRELTKLLKKHKLPNANTRATLHHGEQQHHLAAMDNNGPINDGANISSQQAAAPITNQFNTVSSILAVNQLNLDCDELPSHSMEVQQSNLQVSQQHSTNNQLQRQQQSPQQQQQQQQHQANSPVLANNEDDLLTFQQALAQPAMRGIKSSHNRRPCSNSPGHLNNQRAIDSKSEEDRLLELNQFLSEEYHRHVGSRKRSCASSGGTQIKRLRE